MTYHLVYGLYDSQHLLVADLAVTINVIELERPVQLVLHLSAARNAQGADELFEVDCPGLVRIEDVEDVVCERGRIAEREELLIDLLELLLGEHARRAVLQEACIRSALVHETSVRRCAPLYHCCSSFLSKWVAFWRSASSCWESLLWLLGWMLAPHPAIQCVPLQPSKPVHLQAS